MRIRDRLGGWWASGRIAAVSIVVIFVIGTIWALTLSGEEKEPDVPVIVPSASMADLIARPTPEPTPTAPRPTPASAVAPEPTSTLPEPPTSQRDLLTVAAPPPLDIDYADWYIVMLAFPPQEQYRAARTSWCESGFDDSAVGIALEIGRFQIHPVWFDDPEVMEIIESWFPGATQSVDGIIAALHHEHVNAQVAASIQRRYGWAPWTTRYGCPGWQG